LKNGVWRPPSSFVRHVHLAEELGVRLDRVRLGEHHAALDVFLADAAQEETDVVARASLVEQLAEHLDARDDGLLLRPKPTSLHLLLHLHHAALDAPRATVPRPVIENTSSTGIRNGFVISRLRLRDVACRGRPSAPDSSAPHSDAGGPRSRAP
jgi:hypothetical protein